jgi:hypothetical protein
MSESIEDRLRAGFCEQPTYYEAADLITHLRARVQQLETALTQLMNCSLPWFDDRTEREQYDAALDAAREALLPASNTREGTT